MNDCKGNIFIDAFFKILKMLCWVIIAYGIGGIFFVFVSRGGKVPTGIMQYTIISCFFVLMAVLVLMILYLLDIKKEDQQNTQRDECIRKDKKQE